MIVLTTDRKLLSSLTVMRTGAAFDIMDYIFSISESSVYVNFKKFFQDVGAIYREQYLNRDWTVEELQRTINLYGSAGFLGVAEFIDCMNFYWKNWHLSEKVHFLNKDSSKHPNITYKTWCDRDLYCWNWLSGRPGTNNDQNILSRSPLMLVSLMGHSNSKPIRH